MVAYMSFSARWIFCDWTLGSSRYLLYEDDFSTKFRREAYIPLIYLAMNFNVYSMHLMMVSYICPRERALKKWNLVLYYLFWLKFYVYWISNFNLFLFQAKADEIAKLMNENEQLKALIEDLKVCTGISLPPRYLTRFGILW